MLDRQKAASRVVHPVYLAWKSKLDVVISTEKEIRNKKENLQTAKQVAEIAAKRFALAVKNTAE